MRKKAVVRQYVQYRAEDLKSLTEQRADLVQQMKDLTSTAETEKGRFTGKLTRNLFYRENL